VGRARDLTRSELGMLLTLSRADRPECDPRVSREDVE